MLATSVFALLWAGGSVFGVGWIANQIDSASLRESVASPLGASGQRPGDVVSR